MREVNFFLQGGDQIHRKQGKIEGKGDGRGLLLFFKVYISEDIVPGNRVLSVQGFLLCECSPGQVLDSLPRQHLFLPCEPDSPASSLATEPCEPQPQSSLGGSAISNSWCHLPTLSGNGPTSCLLSCAVPSQSSYSPSRSQGPLDRSRILSGQVPATLLAAIFLLPSPESMCFITA